MNRKFAIVAFSPQLKYITKNRYSNSPEFEGIIEKNEEKYKH